MNLTLEINTDCIQKQPLYKKDLHEFNGGKSNDDAWIYTSELSTIIPWAKVANLNSCGSRHIA